jgi:hypothetical protein
MAFQADGGGDGPESVNQALHESVTTMGWSTERETLKIVFLVGDAPPHMDYENDVLYPEVCKLALDRRLIINTVLCGGDTSTQEVWMEIARNSEGQFVAIPQGGDAIVIATPFDKEIARCNAALNATVCAYGDELVQGLVSGKRSAATAAGAESVADRARFMSLDRASAGAGRGGAKVVGGEGDLVEELIAGSVELAEIDLGKLPSDLAQLPADKLQAELQQRIDDRKKVLAEMDALVKKRADYIESERQRLASEGKTDSFDQHVKQIIRSQAEKVGIDYDK